jgi:hypothetical protein
MVHHMHLASLYGSGRYPGAKGVPKGYDVNDTEYPEGALGRPEEKASDYGTQDSNLGKDILGVDRMKSGTTPEDRPGLSESSTTVDNINTRAVFAQNEKMLKKFFPKPKVTLFEGEELLNEGNIREEVE